MDDDKHCDEPDNCAICHVVMIANKFCSSWKPLGKNISWRTKREQSENTNKVETSLLCFLKASGIICRDTLIAGEVIHHSKQRLNASN